MNRLRSITFGTLLVTSAVLCAQQVAPPPRPPGSNLVRPDPGLNVEERMRYVRAHHHKAHHKKDYMRDDSTPGNGPPGLAPSPNHGGNRASPAGLAPSPRNNGNSPARTGGPTSNGGNATPGARQ